MQNRLDSEGYYHKVYQKIDRFLQPEREASKANLDWVRMQCYWKIGRLLKAEAKRLSLKDFRKLRHHLRQKLKCEPRKLYRLQKFYEYWPNALPARTPGQTLPWSKYVELLTVDEPKAREFYLKETLTSDWSCLQIRKAVQQNLYQNPTSLKRYQKGELLRQRSLINTFWAQVVRVIDGDTLLVNIDLRFGATLTLELRLRGINCAERNDPNELGEKAKSFTENEFRKLERSSSSNETSAEKIETRNSPWVLLVTYKTDKFGRYVADVYYSSVYETEEELLEKGDFLNQKLLSAGLAKRVEY